MSFRMPRRPYLNIVGHWKVWYAISVCVLVISLVSVFTRGLNFGIDFTGGTELTVKAASRVTVAGIRDITGDFGYGDAKIQSAGDGVFMIRVPELTEQKKAELMDALKERADVQKDSEGRYVIDVKDIGPGWGAQVSRQAAIALAVFLFAVLVYVSFRFEFKMGVTAIVETAHDSVVFLGIYSLFGVQVTPATIIAVLTVLGYSLYDTIVVFDRVKENADKLTRQSRKTYSQVVNDSVNQVIVRSMNTSLTTLIPIVSILLFGGATLQAFAFPLFIGVVFGTYSSVIVCPPVLAHLKETEPKYKAYRERVERGQVKGAVPVQAVKKAQAAPKGAAAGKGQATGSARQASAKAPGGAAAGSRPGVGVKTRAGAGQPKEKAAGGEQQPDGAPAPRPKPKPGQAAGKPSQQTSKSRAKSRTKGPGSGKKKKKKR